MSRLLGFCVAVFAVWHGSRMFLPPRGLDGLPADVDESRRAVRAELEAGAADEMQALFPEGHLFMWTLYGLAEADIAEHRGDPAALAHAREALAQVESAAARAPFDVSLEPPYGAFYQGWTTLLRARLVELGVEDERAALFDSVRTIGTAFAQARDPFLPSYPGRAWPCDSVVALAALRTAERAGVGNADRTVDRWLLQTEARLDPTTGLYPHEAGATEARGTSQTILLRYLPLVAPDVARGQYLRFRSTFVVTHFGLPAVREHPGGDTPLYDPGDVDSGPLLDDVSFSASAVAIGTATVNGDRHLADALRHAADAVGVPVGIQEKRYLAGRLPIADAFLLWAKTAPAPMGRAPEGPPGRGWPVPTLALDGGLTLVGLGLAFPWRRRIRRIRRPTTRSTTPPAPRSGGSGTGRPR